MKGLALLALLLGALSGITVLISLVLSQWMLWPWAVAIAAPVVNVAFAASIPKDD